MSEEKTAGKSRIKGCLSYLLLLVGYVLALVVSARVVSFLPGCRTISKGVFLSTVCFIAACFVLTLLRGVLVRARLRRIVWEGVLFTVLVMLAVAAMLPSVAGAPDSGAQRRTVADLRTVMTAMETVKIDLGAYPTARSVEELAGFVEPTFVRKLPRQDGWGNPFAVVPKGGDLFVISHGLCGEPDVVDPGEYEPGSTSSYRADIVVKNGELWVYPDGSQSF